MPNDKHAASCSASKHPKARKGRRPVRVDTILKKGSSAGQDLRLPITGGTKFPTDDSRAPAVARLKASQNVANAGPAPKPMKFPSLAQTVGTPQGAMPKLGEDMAIATDPLILFLKKQAAVLEDNLNTEITGENPPALTVKDPTSEMAGKALDDWRKDVHKLFSATSEKGKYDQKDYEPSPGTVGRLLGQ